MNAETKFTRAKTDLVLNEPFWGYLLLSSLSMVKDQNERETKTMGTDGHRLVWSPKFVDKQTEPVCKTVIAHELCHVCLLHPLRLGDRDPRKANIAMDFAVNQILETCNEEARAKNQAPPFPWPTDPKPLLNPAYKGMAWEEIYNLLPDPPPGGGNGPGSNGKGSPSDSNDPGGLGEVLPGPSDPAAQQELEANLKVAITQAATVAKQQGKLPGDLARLVDELLNPKLPWRQILREFVTSVAKDDFSWTRPNRRYMGSGFILPSLHSNRMGPLAVIVDTSGSIDQPLLDEFMAEIESIAHEARPEKITIIDADAQIQQIREFDPCDQLPREFKGGGGTSFSESLDKLEEDPPAVAIYFSDLCGPMPDHAPSFPLIWATKEDTIASIGTTLKIQ